MIQTNEMGAVDTRQTIRTWRERIRVSPDFPLHAANDVERAMVAEIAELRAQLAHLPDPMPAGWKAVPLEPTPEVMAAAAVATWPIASAADLDLARKAAPVVLMQLNMAPGVDAEMVAGMLATMAPAYRAMVAAAPTVAATGTAA